MIEIIGSLIGLIGMFIFLVILLIFIPAAVFSLFTDSKDFTIHLSKDDN